MADPIQPGPVTPNPTPAPSPAEPESVQKINAFFAGLQKTLPQIAAICVMGANLIASIGSILYSRQASQQSSANQQTIAEHIKLISKKP